MLCAVDVHYQPDDRGARAAALRFAAWDAATSTSEHIVELAEVAPYVPGEFYRRELPPVLAVLAGLAGLAVDILVVDGFVHLDEHKPGLGARLHERLGVPVVGVAKTSFKGAVDVVEVLRGESKTPLFVSAIGVDLQEAVAGVRSMAGAFRLPALLGRVDQLARGIAAPYSQG